MLLTLPACTLLSAAVEFAQLYFPPRVTGLNDIVAESAGAAIGAAFWLVCGQCAVHLARRLWFMLAHPSDSITSLLFAYLAVLVLAQLMPMDLTISPRDIYHKYREGRIQFVPFARGAMSLEHLQDSMLSIALFLPVGLLLTRVALPRSSWPASCGLIAGLGLGLAGTIEFAQVFVYSRFSDATDVVTGGLAVFAGWSLGLLQRRHASRHVNTAAPALWPARAAAAGWLALLVLINWQPFDFDLAPAAALRRLRQVDLIPFADYYQASIVHALDQMSSKVLLFVPLGALVLFAYPGRGRTARTLRGLTLLLVTCLLEAGQLLLPGRYASISDVIFETIGFCLGLALAARIQAGIRPPRAEDRDLPMQDSCGREAGVHVNHRLQSASRQVENPS